MRRATLALTAIVAAMSIGSSRCSGGGQPSSQQQAGTPAADSDGDGIPDSWETEGVDYVDPSDGSHHHLDPRTEGLSPRHKDIIIWVAWMQASDHTHRPDLEAIATVQQAFRIAPVRNPDGYDGIKVHVLFAAAPIPEQVILGSGGLNPYSWDAFDALKVRYFPKEFGDSVFFCVFAHDIDAAHHSGITKTIPGRDFIVSLGGWTNRVGTSQEKAGTLMHELGHAIGLRHGGNDDVNNKPNYLSIMNYLFQMNGLPISGRQGNYDYSEFSLPANEAALSEPMGLTRDVTLSKYGSYYMCCQRCRTPLQRIPIDSITNKTDWNCNGATDASQISTDINADGLISTLNGWDDWRNIVLTPALQAGVAPASIVGTQPTDELTPVQADAIPLFPVTDVHAYRRGNGVLVSWAQVPLDRVVAYRVYRGGSQDRAIVVGTVPNLRNPTFTDSRPAPGVSYFVTATFLPHSYEEAQAPATPSAGTGSQGGGRAVPFVFPGRSLSGWIPMDEVIAIRNATPEAAPGSETLGIVAPDRAAARPARQLLETMKSEGATVK